jgi:hypothetical protein
LIIGAGKSGTSSLYYYLQDHPEGSWRSIYPWMQRLLFNVLTFFLIRVESATEKQVQFFDHQHEQGLQFYLSHFPKTMPYGHVCGEASPGYIIYSQVPQRVCESGTLSWTRSKWWC